MNILVSYPAFALVPFLLFVLLFRVSGRRIALVAAAAWALYAAYELAMKARWLCSGECNIRIDLLVIHPALLLLSAVAVLAALWARPPGRPFRAE